MYPVIRMPRAAPEPPRSRVRSVAVWLTVALVTATSGCLIWLWLGYSDDGWVWWAQFQNWWYGGWQEAETWFRLGGWSTDRVTLVAGLGIVLALYILRRR